VKQAMGAIDQSSGEANQAISKMMDGSGDVHEAMIAMQKADTMFQLTVQIRNKIVQAYQDVMKMPV
jgi:flagellar hook-basal body complex protein FliE